jgi:hypothetical protein
VINDIELNLELEVYHFRPDIDRQTTLVSANGGTGTTFVHTADFRFNLVSDPGTRDGLTTLEVNKLQFDLTTHMLKAGIAYRW